MTEISFVYPFYNNIECVKQRLQTWSSFSPNILKELQFVLIDDCSDEVIDKTYFEQFNLNLIVVRIQTDIMWNQSGAHNLGSYLADSQWLFMMDIDHWIDERSCEKLLHLEKHKNNSFFFPRHYLTGNLLPAPNIYLMTKEMFWKIGGYDEDFAGCYGYEDKLLHMFIKEQTDHSVLSSVCVNVDNAPTRNLDRTRDRNKELLNIKTKQYRSGSYKNGKLMRFEWEKIIQKELK